MNAKQFVTEISNMKLIKGSSKQYPTIQNLSDLYTTYLRTTA